jgi:hypothetical protein
MFQAANSMRQMAESQGGGGGGATGLGMGMGAGMGMLLPGFLQQAMQSAPATAAPATPAQGSSSTPMSFEQLQPTKVNPQDLVRRVAQSNNWTIDDASDVWSITVSIGPLRKQVVRVRFDRQDSEGHAVINYSSACGQATEENAMAFLRYNAQLIHGAFAIESTPTGDMIVMESNQLADTADPLEVTRTVSAIAWQADQVEAKLGGEDQN